MAKRTTEDRLLAALGVGIDRRTPADAKPAGVISWDCSPGDHHLVRKIAQRAIVVAQKHGLARFHAYRDVLMDVQAVHCNGCPLQLAELLAADEANFAHDVFGIRRHLDRNTAQLGGCFVPRFAARAAGQ